MNLCVLYTSSHARYNNPCARYNSPFARNNNLFARYNIPCARNNKLSAQFNNSCKRNKNPYARYNKSYARDNNPFSRYNYLSAQLNNLRQLSAVFFWYNNKRAKWPCISHLSLCLLVYMYLTGKALCWHTRIFDRSHSFIGHQKQFLPNVLEF